MQVIHASEITSPGLSNWVRAMVFLGTLVKGFAILLALAAYLSLDDRLSLAAVQVLLAEALLAAALTPVVFGVIRWEQRFVGAD